MHEIKHWYALYTRPRWEKKVADLLSKKKIENYCPLNKVVRQWSDRKKTIEEPLFTSYVFVRSTQAEMLAIKQTDGVLNFVHWLGRPALIKDEEINTIKQFLSDYLHVKLQKVQVNINDTVRIISGPLMSREGDIIEVRNKTVKVILPSLGYAMIAEVEKAHLEVVNTRVIQKNSNLYTIKI